MKFASLLTLVVFLVALFNNINCEKKKKTSEKKEEDKKNEKKRDTKIGKKVTDYTDADIEKLLDQWDDNDDDYEDEEDDRPWLKPKPKIDMQKIMGAGGNKEQIISESKKGQALMIFANVAGNPTKDETETVSALWQQSLQNANIQVTRYIISEARVLFQVADGSLAFKIKDYLVSQDTCKDVSFENMEFPGKGKHKKKLEL